MSRPAENSEEKIIETGIELSRALGRAATATEIRKALGNRGQFARFEHIWSSYCKTANEEPKREEVELPEDILERVSASVATLEKDFLVAMRELFRRATEQHIRQFSVQETAHAKECAELRKEIEVLNEAKTYLSECLDEYEKDLEGTAESEGSEA